MTFASLRIMRLPRVQFTMRRMMIAVAILGIVMGAEVMRRRSKSFRQRTGFHVAKEISARRGLDSLEYEDSSSRDRLASMVKYRDETTLPMDLHKRIKQIARDKEEVRTWAEWHDQMVSKYTYAASHPWLMVKPDTYQPLTPAYVQRNAALDKALDAMFTQYRVKRTSRLRVKGNIP